MKEDVIRQIKVAEDQAEQKLRDARAQAEKILHDARHQAVPEDVLTDAGVDDLDLHPRAQRRGHLDHPVGHVGELAIGLRQRAVGGPLQHGDRGVGRGPNPTGASALRGL